MVHISNVALALMVAPGLLANKCSTTFFFFFFLETRAYVTTTISWLFAVQTPYSCLHR